MKKGFFNTLKLFFFPSIEEVDAAYHKMDPIVERSLKFLKLHQFSKIINPSTLIYVLVGCFTTLINLGVYYALYFICGKPHDESLLIQIINGIAWLVAVLACFFPNKFYVFRAPYAGLKATSKEFISFVLSRLATLIIETLGLSLFCTVLAMSALIVKPLLAIVVIILNYVFAKLWVFARKVVQ